MRRTSLVVVALLACGVGCAGYAGPAEGAADSTRGRHVAKPDVDDDLREVVLRDLVSTFGAMEWSRRAGEPADRVNVLCIGFGETLDPSAAFMARLADEHRVVQASRCRYDEDGGVVRAHPSGLPAMFLYVEDVRRDGKRAEAKGSYFHDGKAAQEDLFVLERGAERWIVKSRTMISIS